MTYKELIQNLRICGKGGNCVGCELDGKCGGISRILADAPTVDAVEVCYCKDCKHYALWADGHAMNHCDKHDRMVYDDDFRSYRGRRKDEQA